MNTLSAPIDFFFPIITGTILFGLLAGFIVYFILLYRRTQLHYEWEKDQLKKALLQTEVEIREETLKTVSQELHDNIGQIASLVKINLNLIKKHVSIQGKEEVEDSIDLLKNMIIDIKSISAGLNSENLEKKGLLDILSTDVERINKTGYVQLDLQTTISTIVLNKTKLLFLYRMSQEILSNILQHSKASKASLHITKVDQHYQFTFTDNGIGFDLEKEKVSGSGISNLFERSNLIGANLTIETNAKSGTTISISIPI